MKYLRINPQLGFCLLLALYFLNALFQGSWIAIPWLFWPVIWAFGGFLALFISLAGERILYWSSLLLFAIGTLFLLLRIQFIFINGGMDRADANGSPMAFFMGFIFQIGFFLLPGILFFFWNAAAFKQLKKAEQGA